MIGIVILNFNDWSNAVECVKSIDKELDDKCKIYFVDNNSTPDLTSLKTIRENAYKVILLNENKGYSAGNNAGVSAAVQDGCTHILISNTDIIFQQNTISILLRRMSSASYSIIAPRVKINSEMYQEIILGTEINKWSKLLLLLRSTPFRWWVRKYSMKFAAFEHTDKLYFDVYGVSGCCFLMDRRAIKCVTPFDEDFFLYNEEYVISKKISDAGLTIGITNETFVYHLGGQSTRSLKFRSYGYFVKSEQLLLKRYLQAGKCFRFIFIIARMIYPIMQVLNRRISIRDFLLLITFIYE